MDNTAGALATTLFPILIDQWLPVFIIEYLNLLFNGGTHFGSNSIIDVVLFTVLNDFHLVACGIYTQVLNKTAIRKCRLTLLNKGEVVLCGG